MHKGFCVMKSSVCGYRRISELFDKRPMMLALGIIEKLPPDDYDSFA